MFIDKSILRILPALFCLGALLIGSTAFPAPARADSTMTVTTSADELTTNGQCSLREAMTNANNNVQVQSDCPAGSGNDTIVFAAGVNTITLGTPLPDVYDAAGLAIDGGGHVIVSGNNSVGVFSVLAAGSLALRNITVTNGNTTGEGGAVNNAGSLTITNSTFSGNQAAISGGALLNIGNIVITDSTFLGNSTPQDGGAISNVVSTVTIANSTFANNSASYGGALLNNSGTATILNSTFSGNSASTSGGAVGVSQGALPTPTTTIRNTILANSTAGEDCWNGAGAGTLVGANNVIESTTDCTSIATLTGDPNLGALAGSPAYFRLNTGSPAIDAGDDTVCGGSTVNQASQNGIPRPQGSHCDIGSTETPVTIALRSIGARDGWILESSENSNTGGTLNAAAKTFNLGDDAANRQYRAILHFDTSSLPDTAVITGATLMIKKQGLVGTNPFTTHGALRAYLRAPSFGTPALQLADFQSAPASPLVASFGRTPAAGWYSAVLSPGGATSISRSATTQFRLRFARDDNNDHGADFMMFFSGNVPSLANRPALVITYYVP